MYSLLQLDSDITICSSYILLHLTTMATMTGGGGEGGGGGGGTGVHGYLSNNWGSDIWYFDFLGLWYLIFDVFWGVWYLIFDFLRGLISHTPPPPPWHRRNIAWTFTLFADKKNTNNVLV